MRCFLTLVLVFAVAEKPSRNGSDGDEADGPHEGRLVRRGLPETGQFVLDDGGEDRSSHGAADILKHPGGCRGFGYQLFWQAGIAVSHDGNR